MGPPAAGEVVSALFQELVDAVQDEVAVLLRIDAEKVDPGTAGERARTLMGMLGELSKDTTGKDSAEVTRMARYWATRFGGIQRIVEEPYLDSQYSETKRVVEKRIYEVAMHLYDLTRDAQ
jgi:hypothetical protein